MRISTAGLGGLIQSLARRGPVFPSGGMTLVRDVSQGTLMDLERSLTRANPDAGPLDAPYVELFRRHPDGLLVPRYFDEHRVSSLGRVEPVEIDDGGFEHVLSFPPRPEQVQITSALDCWDGDVGVRAPCGFGKTYVAAYYAARLGGRCLVIVPNQNKMNEWRREMARFMGLRESDVGHVQADVRRWREHPVTVAMSKTMALQDFPEEFERGFRLTVVDEAHLVQAPVLSRALGKVAGRRMALTATPGRGLRREITELHCGGHWLCPDVEQVRCRFEFLVVPVWDRLRAASWDWLRIEIAKDVFYSRTAAQVTEQLMDQGRRVLVINSQVQPLLDIYKLLRERGGFVCGHESVRRAADAFPRLQTQIDLRDEVRLPARLDGYIADVKRSANPILGIGLTKTQPAGTGMDVPDLDGGVIMLPVASPDMVTQLVGRWGRVHPGKKQPLVVVMVPDTAEAHDRAHAMRSHLARLGADVVEQARVIPRRSF